ncbi:MAG: MBL fold metallo-hydrolase [Syntrophobacteraceae bacterium]|nr:MBL fold metallo-hydrolase [Syntrophobacteraceae bacterium]
MAKITDEVFMVGGGRLTAPEDAAVYLIHFSGHAAIVDAGCGFAGHELIRNINRCGVDSSRIEYLLITHCHFDHTGGVHDLRSRLKCRVVAHELEAEYLERGDNRVTAAGWYGAVMKPFQVDIRLSGSETEILLGERVVRAIHTPGHSPGSVVYVVDSCGKKILFGQDVHGPVHPDLLSDRDQYIRSLNLLLALDADILCEGHYGIFRGKQEVARFIKQFL